MRKCEENNKFFEAQQAEKELDFIEERKTLFVQIEDLKVV